MGMLDIFTGKHAEKSLDIVESGVEGIKSGLDKMFYTDEEKADASRRITELHLKFIELSASENTVRSITRRYLAIMIMGIYLSLEVGSVIAYPFNMRFAQYIQTVGEDISPLALSVAIFFFGYYGIKRVVGTIKGEA